ncbi:MAG: DUF1275 family protein [Verrucomicrobia bacterium]|nr:DUF1275 family protein [Verrucomicrobiota bacterium]MBU6445871.1 DUF1275 family protein [Verrucomicrobiota bacterium]MDE3046931.1 DUF1275 domain-containing protein [Verrucomicrobiota bacterium]
MQKMAYFVSTRSSGTAFLMAFISGLVDVFGFIALSKLFTAHITGNIVIAIAEIIYHVPGVAAKLIALPVFILIAILVTWVIEAHGQTTRLLRALLLMEAFLLLVFMLVGSYVIPMGRVGSWPYISVGMLAVAAMAIHNTLLRTFMVALPPCTVMTGNFSQLIVDFVSYHWGKNLSYPVESLQASIANMHKFGNVLLGFMLGGLIAAVGFSTIDFWIISVAAALLLFMSAKAHTPGSAETPR